LSAVEDLNPTRFIAGFPQDRTAAANIFRRRIDASYSRLPINRRHFPPITSLGLAAAPAAAAENDDGDGGDAERLLSSSLLMLRLFPWG